jgi:predicted DCC family thiol-disulfide oxidoreductase YuxK
MTNQKSQRDHDSFKTHGRLRVYFDGLCPLCSREISYYITRDGAAAIDWIDITASGFDAEKEGLDPKKVHRFFHVKDESGRIVVGIDAFIEIWSRIPSLKHWKTIAALPGVRPMMKLGYYTFAKVRPLLPRRKSAILCPTDSCFVAKDKG